MRCYHGVSKNPLLTQGETGSLEVTSVYNIKGRRKFCAPQVDSEWKGERVSQHLAFFFSLSFPFQMVLSLSKSFDVLKEF